MFIKERSLETQSVVSNCTCFKFTRKLLVQWTSTVLFFKGESSVALGDCPRVPPFSNYCKSRDGWCNNHVLS